MSSGDLRAFLAVELAPPVRAELARLSARLVAALPAAGRGVGWASEEGVHLTLVFLGAVAPAKLEALGARLGPLVRAHPAFSLSTTSPGCFPSPKAARVLWLGLSWPSRPLAALQAEVAGACAEEGLGADDHPFHPHLTAGRVKDRGLRAAAGAGWVALSSVAQPVEVAAVSLMRSQTLSSGPKYTRLERFELG